MTRFCTCPGSLALSLEYSRKRNKLAEASCKTCGGRFVVDGIGPISRSMLGTVGLEVASSINPEFNWKTVTKGKRSRKAVARCMNRGLELGNKSPKRVGDFSGSDSDKFGEMGNGQCFSDKAEYVPLKKRRHFFRSPSPSSRPPYGGESVSPQLLTPSSHSEDLEHLSDHNGSSGSYTNRLAGPVGNDVDIGVAGYKVSDLTTGVFYNSDNFSGIALLAAAACINNIDDDAFNDKVDAMEVSSAPQRSDDTSTSSLSQREAIDYSESGKQGHMKVSGLENKGRSVVEGSVNASHSLYESEKLVAVKSVSLKVDRLHWDLNTSMDAWEQPNNDSDNTKEDNRLYVSNVGMQTLRLDREGRATEKASTNKENDDESCLPVDRIENAVECSISRLEENDSEEFCCHDRLGMKETSLSTLNESSREPINFASADTKFCGHLISGNEFMDNSPKAESCHSSEVSGGYVYTKSDCMVVTQGEDSCRNATASSLLNPSDHNVAFRDDSDLEKLGSENDAQIEVAEDSLNITELPDNRTSPGLEMCLDSCKTSDAENPGSISGNNSYPSSKHTSVTASDISTGGESDGSSEAEGEHAKLLAASTIGTDAGKDTGSKEILSKHEDPHLSNGESEGIHMLEESGCILEDCQNLDVSQDDHMEAAERMAEFEVGYDSPYEDGELRGSASYSWEENAFVDVEQECLDYESDGRGGEDSAAADFPEPKIVEADSEGTDQRSLLAMSLGETDTMKSGSGRSPLRKEFENENSEKTEASGDRTSNQGSGSTEEVSADVIVERSHGSLRRRLTADHMDVIEERGPGMGEVRSKTIRGKLQSRIEGRSSLDTMERDVSHSRSRDGGIYVRDERYGVPDRFVTGYKTAVHNRERNEGDSECVYWDSRNRYSSGYCGLEGHRPTRQRTAVANSIEKFGGVDSRDQKHPLNYSSRAERDSSPDRFVSRYRSAGQERDRNGGNGQISYWDPRMRYPSSYHGPEDNGQTRPRSAISDSVDKFGGYSSYDRKHSVNYSSKSMQRPLGWRRSPIDRDDYHGGPRRIPGFSSSGNRGGSRKFSEGVSRGFREEYHHPVNDDNPSAVRASHYVSWRERDFFPHSTRGAHVSVPHRSSRSRSRTRSPRAWLPQRERNVSTRRHSRSPDFRSESRMDRMRAPFQKSNFGADYGDSFMTPPRGRFSPPRSFRRADDRNIVDSHLRHQRSPFNVFRQGQRLDSVGLSGRLKSDDSFRPTMRPGRFPLVAPVGRGCQLEDSNEDKGHDDRSGTMH